MDRIYFFSEKIHFDCLHAHKCACKWLQQLHGNGQTGKKIKTNFSNVNFTMNTYICIKAHASGCNCIETVKLENSRKANFFNTNYDLKM